MKKAAIYLRVSSEKQAGDDKVSIESQLADCEAYCKQKGYTVVARYVDKEKYRVKGRLVQPSGQRKDRPGYKAMLKAAQAGEFDVIVAWKEDRLYRGMYAAIPLSELLDEKGKALEIELVKETFDRKMVGVKAAVGKIEVDNIRERTMMGRKARLEKGQLPGGNQVKYGYKRVDKHLEMEEPEAEIVHQIFAWYIAGENTMSMRRRLIAMGTPTRKGELWSKRTIKKIVTFEGYATGKIPTTLDGETFYLPAPPIITMETWDKAQKVRIGNKVKARNVKNDYLCVGLVYCVCGWKAEAKSQVRNKYENLVGYYRCRRPETKPETCPHNCFHSIGSQKLDKFVWNYIKLICEKPAALKKAIDLKLEALKAEQGDFEGEIDKLQKTLDELMMERQKIITWGRKSVITEEDMELQLDAIGLQELAFKRTLEEKLAASEARRQIEDLSAWAEQYLSDIRGGVEELDTDPEKLSVEDREAWYTEIEAWRFEEKYPGDKLAQLKWAILEEKRRVVRTLISRVEVSKEGKVRKIDPVLSLEVPVKSSTLEPSYLSPGPKVHTLVFSFSLSELQVS